jgi:hypothetical protein
MEASMGSLSSAGGIGDGRFLVDRAGIAGAHSGCIARVGGTGLE